MDITRDCLRGWLKSLNTSSVILLCFSLLLSACGGGGPGDEGEGSATSTTSSQNSTVTNSSTNSSNTASLLSENSYDNQQDLCQQQNSLLCEDFEWSSSLAYKASEFDLSLKGWTFTGMELSGNNCGAIGVGNSQCALKLVQANDKFLDINQKASYSYAQYGAGFKNILLSWSAKWSEQWVWGAEAQSHLVLESTNANKTSHSLFSVVMNSNGFIQLIISGDEQCLRDEIIVESDKSFALQEGSLGNWQQFKMDFNLDTEGVYSEVSLSVNDKVIIAKTDIALGCSAEYTAPDTVSFIASSYNQQITAEQNVLIDNVQISYK